MKNKEQIISKLNQALNSELVAINQYIYFHIHCENKGFVPLAKAFLGIAIKEMYHVEQLGDRILNLKGVLKMEVDKPVVQILSVKDMIEKAMEMESTTIEDYSQFAKYSRDNDDIVTAELFESLIKAEDEHFNFYETELDNAIKFKDQYLALQSVEHTKEQKY